MAHIWLLGNSVVSGGTFANGNEESSATTLEGRGHTVTRRQSSGVTAAPLTSDCDVVLHMDGGVGGEQVLRGTATNAAPVLGGNTYYYANSWGHTALVSRSSTTDASGDTYEILSTVPGWTAGYAVNDTVTVWPFAVYQEMLDTPASGGVAFLRTTAANRVICYGFDVGTTNLASATTTTRMVMVNFFSDIFRYNAAGLQILDDLIIWAIGTPPAQQVSAVGHNASPSFGSAALAAGPVEVSAVGHNASPSFGSAALAATVTLGAVGHDASPSFGTTSVDASNKIGLTGLDASPSFGVPTLVPDQQLAAVGFDASPSFGVAGFVYDQTLGAVGFDASPSFGAPDRTATITLTATGLDASPSFGVPRLFLPPPVGWQVLVRSRDDLDGPPVGQLFNVLDIKALVLLNGIGAGELTMPLHSPDLLAVWDLVFDDDAVLDLHYGRERRFRMRVDDVELSELGDDSSADGLSVTLYGPTFAGELDEMVVLPENHPLGQGAVRDLDGPGMQAWGELVEQTLDVGGGQLLSVGFGAEDSYGQAWPSDTEVAARIDVGTTLLQAVQALQVPGKAEWWVDADGVLQAAPQKGTDRSDAVMLRVGAHQLIRRRRMTRRRIVNQALVMGPDGTIEAVDDPTSVSVHGGRMSVIRSATNDVDDRQALGAAVIEARSEPVVGIEVQVPAFALGARLWSDWDLGDTVSVELEGLLGGASIETARVQALVFETDMVETNVEVTLGSADEIAEEVFEARFAQVLNGQRIGLQQAAGTIANQLGVEVGGLDGVNPTDLSVVARGGAAVNEAAINVGWTAPTGAGAAAVVGYEVAIADPAVFAFGVARDRRRTSTTSQAVFGLIPNVEYTVTVFALNVLGERIGSAEVTHTTPLDSTDPAQVTGLSVIGDVGQLRAVWTASSDSDVANGRGDYQVQVSSNSGFSALVLDVRTAATIASLPGLTTGTTYWVRVRAVDSSGNTGPWSASANAGPRPVTGSDIGSGTVTGGNIGSGTVTGGNIGSGTVEGGNIAAGTITATNIAAGTITATQIESGTITGTQISAGSINGDRITAGTLHADRIQAGTITATQIESGAITASMITAGTMSADRINGGTITGTSINIGGGAFTVSSGGAVTASNYSLTGSGNTITNCSLNTATITGGTINIGSGAFGVNSSGQVWMNGSSYATANWQLNTNGELRMGAALRFHNSLSWPFISGSSDDLNLTNLNAGHDIIFTASGRVRSASDFQASGFLDNPGHPTGSFANNANVAPAGGRLRRDTSSIRGKDDVRARSGSDRATLRTGAGADAIEVGKAKTTLSLDPVWYVPKVTDRPGDWSGFIAEDAEALGLRHLVYYADEEQTVPEGFDYARLGVDHHVILQHHEDRLDRLEQLVASAARERRS